MSGKISFGPPFSSEAEKGEYHVLLKDYTESIDALRRAIEVLKAQPKKTAGAPGEIQEARKRASIDWQEKIQGDFAGPQKYF